MHSVSRIHDTICLLCMINRILCRLMWKIVLRFTRESAFTRTAVDGIVRHGTLASSSWIYLILVSTLRNSLMTDAVDAELQECATSVLHLDSALV